MEALLLPRLSTDDGTTVEAALDQLSAEEFDGLLSGVTFGAEVPPESASSSSSPSVDEASPPTGLSTCCWLNSGTSPRGR